MFFFFAQRIKRISLKIENRGNMSSATSKTHWFYKIKQNISCLFSAHKIQCVKLICCRRMSGYVPDYFSFWASYFLETCCHCEVARQLERQQETTALGEEIEFQVSILCELSKRVTSWVESIVSEWSGSFWAHGWFPWLLTFVCNHDHNRKQGAMAEFGGICGSFYVTLSNNFKIHINASSPCLCNTWVRHNKMPSLGAEGSQCGAGWIPGAEQRLGLCATAYCAVAVV